MIRLFRNSPPSNIRALARLLSSQVGVDLSSASKTIASLRDTNYQVQVASILVRNPIILRTLTPFELAYEEYRASLQEEYSRGTFEIMTSHKRELAAAGLGDTQSDTEVADLSRTEQYKQAEGNVRDIQRKLERKVYFVIKDAEGRWRFPSAVVPDAQLALHKFAPQIVRDTLGEEAEIYYMGNAPLALHQERIPDRVSPPLGVKVSHQPPPSIHP